ncbi:MAG: hypothetical protein M1821_006233 [Bathelium mastoideum]|nr:MAG: hypothetical protein M1821_006233 [Bathelium mastoideum]KAI9686572.1 MAG: hypothetical protein M1822_003583 [Bathelium mastoideum]
MSKSQDPASKAPAYEKTLATSGPYRNSRKLSPDEQLAADLEEFRREKEYVYPGQGGTFAGRDFAGSWAMGAVVDRSRDTMSERARREEQGIKYLKSAGAGTVNRETGVVSEEQSDWRNVSANQEKMKRVKGKGWKEKLKLGLRKRVARR